MPSQVILFKAPLPPHNIASDPYYQLLRKQGYEPTFIPVLEESFEAQEIESVLLGRQGAFDAVVITSRRGAEGWLKAAQSVLETGHAHPDWRPIPLHTVGRSALEALSAAPPSLIPLIPSVPGHTAKSAEALLPLLLHETSSNGDGRDHALTKSDALSMESKADKRYLYVRGDKSADILQGALRGAGCEVREVRVYRTQERPGLEEDVKRVLAGVEGIKRTGPEDEGAMLVDSAELGSMRTDTAPHDGREEERPGQSNTNTTGTVAVDATVKSDDKDADDHSTANNGPAETIWLAFFSPSSAAFVLAHLPRSVLANMVPHDSATYSIDSPVDTPQAVGANGLQRPAGAKFDMVVRTFAIGETTRRYLLTRGIRADAVADTPDAEGLGRAIAIFDASW